MPPRYQSVAFVYPFSNGDPSSSIRVEVTVDVDGVPRAATACWEGSIPVANGAGKVMMSLSVPIDGTSENAIATSLARLPDLFHEVTGKMYERLEDLREITIAAVKLDLDREASSCS
jgi:hypothetical protein